MQKTILLAEDDSFVADVYTNNFKKEGYKVDVANDGQMALEKIKMHHPDLVVLDIGLPKIEGLEVLKMMREDEATKNIKVIIISNLNEEDYAQKIANLGVLKHFLKIESTPEEITKAVKEILK